MYRVSEVWIALIYVVIEGYEGLNVRDERVDVLLTDAERVTTLRRFRNALFHPQTELSGQPHLVRRRKRRFPRVLRERGPDGRVIRLVWGRAGEGS
jgi:hypothetical protein